MEILLIPDGIDMRPGKPRDMAAWYVFKASRERFEFPDAAEAERFIGDNLEIIVEASNEIWLSAVVEVIDLKNGRFGIVVLAPNMLTERIEVRATPENLNMGEE